MRWACTIAVASILTGAPAGADELEQGLAPESCIVAAGAAYRVPPAVLLILLNVEDGALGQVSSNANGTVDIGPMQVNQIWLPKLAAHWKAPVETAYTALRDDFCANVEGGAWILRQAIDEAQGDFWAGVGHYHSHDPAYEARYLRLVLSQARNLQTEAAVTSVQDSGQGD